MGLRVSSLELLFIYTQICLFLKCHHFGKCSHLVLLYIIGYNDILWRVWRPLHPNIWGSQPWHFGGHLIDPSCPTEFSLGSKILIHKVETR